MLRVLVKSEEIRNSKMKILPAVTSSLLIAAACTLTPTALADSTEAHCEFYSHGDKKKDRSGPCTFSQRQGYIDIGLSNGKTFNLSPGKKPDHFKDQEDHKVVRKNESGNKQVYKWDQKKIVVSFGGGQQSSQANSNKVAVKDMARYCAGEASAKFSQKPGNISTQPAIKDQGMYSVFGQYPPSGADPKIFICTFSADGEFVGVDKQ
jgi:hypothetical protein